MNYALLNAVANKLPFKPNYLQICISYGRIHYGIIVLSLQIQVNMISELIAARTLETENCESRKMEWGDDWNYCQYTWNPGNKCILAATMHRGFVHMRQMSHWMSHWNRNFKGRVNQNRILFAVLKTCFAFRAWFLITSCIYTLLESYV